jgi:hypothetical protein
LRLSLPVFGQVVGLNFLHLWKFEGDAFTGWRHLIFYRVELDALEELVVAKVTNVHGAQPLLRVEHQQFPHKVLCS